MINWEFCDKGPLSDWPAPAAKDPPRHPQASKQATNQPHIRRQPQTLAMLNDDQAPGTSSKRKIHTKGM